MGKGEIKMSIDIVIYGSGGFGRETLALIKDINKQAGNTKWNVLGFLDDSPHTHGSLINGFLVLGDNGWIENYQGQLAVVIAIGNPIIRKLKHNQLKRFNIEFPNLIHPSVIKSNNVLLGEGTLICAGSILTTEVSIGDFVIINLSCTVGHDVVVRSYSNLLPSCNISGNVLIEECVDVGTRTCIIPNVTVGENSIIGAGATVIRNIPPNCTAVGSPAKPIKYNNVG